MHMCLSRFPVQQKLTALEGSSASIKKLLNQRALVSAWRWEALSTAPAPTVQVSAAADPGLLLP